jgi:hypothetical protein
MKDKIIFGGLKFMNKSIKTHIEIPATVVRVKIKGKRCLKYMAVCPICSILSEIIIPLRSFLGVESDETKIMKNEVCSHYLGLNLMTDKIIFGCEI